MGRAFPEQATCAATSRGPPASWLALRPASHALLSARQFAYKLNQPLNFDTSSVTSMYQMFYGAAVFNQPLSFNTSSVTSMSAMFAVRSSLCPAPNLQSSPPLNAACPAVEPATSRAPVAHTLPRTVCPPFDSAGHTLPVQHEQAAHPLRVGGHLGLRLRWIWLELGSGDLPLATTSTAAAALPAATAALASTTATATTATAVAAVAAANATPVIRAHLQLRSRR